MLFETTCFSAGATVGTVYSLLLRMLKGISEELDGPSITIQNIGANGTYNYHFNRGWYIGDEI